MRIKKLQIKNGYKRFHDLTIDLGDNPKRIIALVGPNGCGKSSVLNGLISSFATTYHHSVIGGQIGYESKPNEFYSSRPLPTDPSFKEWFQVDFDVGTLDTVYNSKKSEGKEKTIFSLRSPYRYNSDLKIKESKSLEDIKKNNYGASSFSDLDDKVVNNYRRLLSIFNRYLKDNRTTATYQSTADKIIGDINAALKNCLNMEIAEIGDIESNRGTLYFIKPDQKTPFEFNVLSSGEKEVVDILLDLYVRKEEYNDTVFLIYEPELHVNTAIQRSLLLEINKMVGENCQIWITTHSIGFMRALQNDLREECQIIHFPADVNWASETQVLQPMSMTRAKWKELFSIALEDLTDLISPKTIVYCEGKDKPGGNGQERGLDAKVYNTIVGEKYPDVLFVSAGGNTELDQRSDIALAILGKALPELQVLVLKDRDAGSGKPVSETDRNEYLQNNPDHHRMLKRWEIENYLFDKEVLKAYCEKKGKPFDESVYDAAIADICNEAVKEQLQKIRNCCDSRMHIKADIFKVNLAQCITPEMEVYKELEACVFKSKSV